MSVEVNGINLSSFDEPIKDALAAYEEETDGRLRLMRTEADKDATAIKGVPFTLEVEAGKPNAARLVSTAFWLGRKIGTVYTIAFAPGDGTGAEAEGENGYQLKDLVIDKPYPWAAKVVPRKKDGVIQEAHMVIARQTPEDVHAEIEMFQGVFDLLSFSAPALNYEMELVTKVGELGKVDPEDVRPEPYTTLTVGKHYRKPGQPRFGDPHAIYNSQPALQVCAFLAIEQGTIPEDVLAFLGPREPRWETRSPWI